ncbi:MAG: DUF1501 domain-containing protein [Planctomycetes bacterium]|nr:DUF1501 domain-containing protein [Planctomycetota bacterium]
MSRPLKICIRCAPPYWSRREMLRRAGLGIGSLALTSLMLEDGVLRAGEETSPIFNTKRRGRAKSVIFLFMGGGPSQVDTFDPKPDLSKLHDQEVPASIARNLPLSAMMGNAVKRLLGCPFQFSRYGECGLPVSELFAETGKLADELCVLRSVWHDTVIHVPGEYMLTTGSILGDRPSLGAWLCYGLGSDNQDLPGFLVLGGKFPNTWSAGFLPARFQGVALGSGDQKIPNLNMPAGLSASSRRAQLDLIAELNHQHLERQGGGVEMELEARIRSYELAFRMQSAAPEAFDLRRESEAVRRLYGLDQNDTAEYGSYCLLARRLVERGVRFVQVRAEGWDSHGDLKGGHLSAAKKTDRPIAGLLRDLKQRGLLDETVVIWGGEFGRTPTMENPGNAPGRDHSPGGFSMWLAGGGVKGGQAIGSTDPVGYRAVERPIHVNDLHATILHALGIDQHQLYFLHHNRKEIVTVNGGEVIQEAFS